MIVINMNKVENKTDLEEDTNVEIPFLLKTLIEKQREFNVETCMAFIDLERAFDEVNMVGCAQTYGSLSSV
jgi:hypothetical protein